VEGSGVVGSTALVLAGGATPLRVEQGLFEEMLAGWERRQRSRRLSAGMIGARSRVVRRFAASTGAWPWAWTPGQFETWVAEGSWAYSTVRSYQGAVAGFLDYACDPRYGWVAACRSRVGAAPVQVCGRDNMAVHCTDYEGRPERRPLSRVELQAFFDAADERVEALSRTGHKGWLSAFRDATLFKVIYGWGLRRTEAAMLDREDFTTNPAAPQLGNFGVAQVRFGKAMRGSPPRRRAVASVMPWAVEALEQYLSEVRPRYEVATSCPALWLTERGQRLSPRSVDDRFATLRSAAGLPVELSVHCLRHSYVSHLIEDGVDPLFVQQQVGHSWASTTAIYTSVGADAKNRMLRAALAGAFTDPPVGHERPGEIGR
jgi:integrase/recombinase XerC